MSQAIGQPISRLDGRAKVTGQARYAADWPVAGMVHAVLFQSTIPSGKIRAIDDAKARQVPGVIEIMTFKNAPKVKELKMDMHGFPGESFSPLQDNKIFYNGQHIGAAIAETLEEAQEAASLIKVTYTREKAELGFKDRLNDSHKVKTRNGEVITTGAGNFKKGLASSSVTISEEYAVPLEFHNPMEPAATVAVWNGDELTVYDSTQNVYGVGSMLSNTFKIGNENTHVITKFVGGGFGCKGSMWNHVVLSAMAAQMTKRPVKLVVTRQQMFTSVGHRPEIAQKVTLGAKENGELQALEHLSWNSTAINKDYSEPCGSMSKMMYKCENVNIEHRLVKLNFQVPTFMRAPGEAPGSFALETAMDELAHKLKMDPLDLRLHNYATEDQISKKPFSSKGLNQCYEAAANAFGWKKRNPEPGRNVQGEYFIGYGMASSTYPVNIMAAKASAELRDDGTATVLSATQDLGTGSYTAFAQISADALGLPLERVKFDLGDNKYPSASVSGGSSTVGSVGWAIRNACDQILDQLRELAIHDKDSPIYNSAKDDLIFGDGEVRNKSNSKREDVRTLMKRNRKAKLTAEGSTRKLEKLRESFSSHAFGAQFVEVHVHRLTGEVRVARITGAFASGTIINPKTAKSQYMGGMIFGIGAALMEHNQLDQRYGRPVIRDLGEYHVPVNLDVPDLDIIMIKEFDEHGNPQGSKGIGEIGIVGTAAAIGNAIFNATGVRLRELPFTPDKLVGRMTI